MARRVFPERPQKATLTPDQMRRGIVRLEKRLEDLNSFDPQSVQKRWSPEVTALQKSIESTLEAVFGTSSTDYERYRFAAKLDNGPLTMRSEFVHGSASQSDEIRKAQGYLTEGKSRAIQILKEAIRGLKEELAEAEEGVHLAIDLTLHTEIQEKCWPLYASGHFSEAVEKSFKVVRDRLRQLTGYEKGSEAFGRGNLYIQGAAAPHVEEDFNQGAKFLMMAIDMFRNEKSHTSDAKITDPLRARHYLLLSSLAMHLLADAEIRST